MAILMTTAYLNCTVYLCVLTLEYAAPVWDPHLTKDTNKLESVQKFALKMCLKQWDLGYQDLLDLSQLPTLENRRLYLKLCTFYKIIHGYFYFPPNVFVPQVSRQRYSLPLMHQPHAHTNALSLPCSCLLYLALFLFGITYPMKHLQHIPLIHLNHSLHPCFCIHNWLHTRISLPAICASLH